MLNKHSIPRKPHRVLVEGVDDFFELFKKIEKHYETCFFLESLGEDSHISRHSVIGFSPTQILSATGKTLTVTEANGEATSHATTNPYYALRELLPQDILSRNYCGGLTGYLGYDAMNYFEPSLDIQSSELFEAFKFGLYEDGLTLDKMTGEISYFYYTDSRLDEIKAIITWRECNESS